MRTHAEDLRDLCNTGYGIRHRAHNRGGTMSIVVTEDLAAPAYRFTDPDAFLSCDNPI